MPLYKGKNISDEAAVAKGLCPETSKPLADIEDMENHITKLWPKDKSPEAVKRIDMLREHRKQNPYVAPADDAE